MLALRYLTATVAASICFVSLLVVPIVWAIRPDVSGEIILSDLVMVPILILLTVLISIPLALPWASLAILIANRFRLDSVTYWTIAGAIAGTVSASFGIWAFDDYPSMADDGSAITYASEWWRLAPISLIAGTVGGFVFKRIDAWAVSPAR